MINKFSRIEISARSFHFSCFSFSHPLFPLLVRVFEKCERATSLKKNDNNNNNTNNSNTNNSNTNNSNNNNNSSDTECTSESFGKDIENFSTQVSIHLYFPRYIFSTGKAFMPSTHITLQHKAWFDPNFSYPVNYIAQPLALLYFHS